MEYVRIIGGKFGGGGAFNPSRDTGVVILVVAVVVVIVGMIVMGRAKE